MTTIIRAADRSHAVQAPAFNLADLQTDAQAYLAGIREEARKIVAQAAEDADAIRQAAEVQGLRAADAALDRKVGEQLKTVLPALRKVIDEVQQSKAGWIAEWQQKAVHLATGMAARIVRRELRTDPGITLTLVHEALEMATGGSEVRVLLNPADYQALGRQVETVAAEFSQLGPVAIVPDAYITLGGCRVETRHGVIDQQIETQLARIERELI